VKKGQIKEETARKERAEDMKLSFFHFQESGDEQN
jgi:hypothetical protein